MLQKYIHFKVFIISLAVGLLGVYLYQPDPTIIYVYPTPNNVNNIQLKDNAFNYIIYYNILIILNIIL